MHWVNFDEIEPLIKMFVANLSVKENVYRITCYNTKVFKKRDILITIIFKFYTYIVWKWWYFLEIFINLVLESEHINLNYYYVLLNYYTQVTD